MTTAERKIGFTAADLLQMDDAKAYELADGRLERREMGTRSSWIGTEIVVRLRAFCNSNRLGWVFASDVGYQCFPDDAEKVRRPDISFIRFGRLPNEQLPEGHTPIAPDLAVEVLSPKDRIYKLERKIREYLSAGVRLVWIVNPDSRRVRIHRLDGPVSDLGGNETLEGESVLPGFSCRVGDLFEPAR